MAKSDARVPRYRLDMKSSLLGDAFAHHAWATLQVMDACEALTSEQLETMVPGTFGSIIDTMRHIVGADSWCAESKTQAAR